MDITWWVIIGTAVFLIAYDIWTIAARGVKTSISWQIWSFSNKWVILAFAFGVLMGHFFWSQKPTCEKLIEFCK